MERNLSDMLAELEGISHTLYALSEFFQQDEERSIDDKTVHYVLFAAFNHIDRITDELSRLPKERMT